MPNRSCLPKALQARLSGRLLALAFALLSACQGRFETFSVSELAPAVTRSWQAGRPVETDTPRTFAEGLATRVPAAMTLELMRQLVADMVLVSDAELREGVRLLLRLTHNLAEGAGAAATAAALRMGDRIAGKRVVGVLSGGNLDLRELVRILNEQV